jgi:uncharacterized coiled-coil protein SlyX
MPVLDEFLLEDPRRIAELETRVAALEWALAQLCSRLAPQEAVDLERTQPMNQIVAQERVAKANVYSFTPATTTRHKPLDPMHITSGFESLDARLAEEAAAEHALLRKAPYGAPVVEIDPTLIDKAFAKPPPQKVYVSASLEDMHPKILQRVCLTWRTPELLKYLRKLIVDERGDRAGFDPDVMSELLLLSAILEEPNAYDTWSANNKTI